MNDIPLGRLASPAKLPVCAFIYWSDEAAFITGADFPIDGGLTAR